MLEIHGVPFSAHTRKVIIAALEKAIPYTLRPVVPLKPPPGWAALSPLGKIPVIRDDGIVIADSSVILQYLERTRTRTPLLPDAPADQAHALWIEEFVDGGLAPPVLHDVLLEKVFAQRFLGRPCDEPRVRRAIEETIPPKLAYLEGALAGDWFAGGAFGIADLTVASILINYHYAGMLLSTEQYPKLHDFLRRVLQRDSVRKAMQAEIPAARDLGGLDMTWLQGTGYPAGQA